MVLRIDTGGEFVIRGVGDPAGPLDASNMRYTDTQDMAEATARMLADTRYPSRCRC